LRAPPREPRPPLRAPRRRPHRLAPRPQPRRRRVARPPVPHQGGRPAAGSQPPPHLSGRVLSSLPPLPPTTNRTTTMPTLFKRFALLALPAMLVLSACDSNDDHDDDHFGQLERVEVRDRATGFLYATYTRSTDDTFEGSVELGPGQELALNVLFFDEDDREASLGEGRDYTLGIRLAETDRDGVEGTPGIVAF